MADLALGRREARAEQRSVLGLVLLMALASVLLGARAWWRPRVPPGLIVEVSGEVARPGLYVVDPPTLAAAVEVAGGLADGLPETPLAPGDAVEVTPEGARVVAASEARHDAPGAEALLDLNAADAPALEALPGIGPALAARIVADREARGPFADVDALDRVKGIGPALVETVRPHVRVAP